MAPACYSGVAEWTARSVSPRPAELDVVGAQHLSISARTSHDRVIWNRKGDRGAGSAPLMTPLVRGRSSQPRPSRAADDGSPEDDAKMGHRMRSGTRQRHGRRGHGSSTCASKIGDSAPCIHPPEYPYQRQQRGGRGELQRAASITGSVDTGRPCAASNRLPLHARREAPNCHKAGWSRTRSERNCARCSCVAACHTMNVTDPGEVE